MVSIKKHKNMEKQLSQVREFHEKFLHPVSEVPTLAVNEQLRYNLMKEENDEYLEAAQDGDLVGVADALGDQLYILCGTILAHGMQNLIEEVFDEIQRSNMSKLGSDGNPVYREDGKIMKGPNYTPPDLKKIVSKYCVR
jgi:predicted HAD superfamily Cof-like phosphohydrolase